MKKRILFGTGLILLMANHAFGALYTETFSGVNMAIPDGNPVGVTLSGTVTDIPSGWAVSGLTVSLNINGGYNGDLYSYLVAPDGTMVVLMNQPGVAVNGFGASGAGMNITLSDAGGTSIQSETSGSVLSGTYSAAGSLVNFNGAVADGTWTLYFADLSSGGGISTLNGWSLGITAIPEPTNLAMAFFGVLLGGAGAFRYFRSSAKRQN